MRNSEITALPAPARAGSEAASTRAALAYSTPMAIFLALTFLEGQLPQAWYPFLYCTKVCLVTLSLAVFRRTLSDIRPTWRVVVPAALIGLGVCVAWVGIDRAVPYPHLGTRVGFNPFEAIPDTRAAMAFVAVRLFGLALLVPVMEELFWRAFLLRYLTTTDFLSVPFEAFSWSAFWMVAGAFSLAHPEWLPAAVTACVYGLLLRRTRSVFAAVVAHAVTNAALGVYILVTHSWVYW
jgi:CAAX prenyl protease-like protein